MDTVILPPDDDDEWEPRRRRSAAADPEDDLDAHAFFDEERGEGEDGPGAADEEAGPFAGDYEAELYMHASATEPGGEPRARHAGPRGMADAVLDELLPEQLDWKRLVRTYPIPSLVIAALGGFLLGRSKGVAVVGALSTFAANAVAENINEILGEELI